jgi:solute carrier family 13 (sodium-dependent dicarboxylate transporter), member 2/3/5
MSSGDSNSAHGHGGDADDGSRSAEPNGLTMFTTKHDRPDSPSQRERIRRWSGLISGPPLAVLVYALVLPSAGSAAALTAAVAVLMALWWMTEALPIPATALVPLIVFPLFTDSTVTEVGAEYGNSVIFLFMGGFLLALTVQRWDLHRRLALLTMRLAGDNPVRVIGVFMATTAALSMWVSNTATAVMMLPIGVSVLALVLGRINADTMRTSNFATGLMLGIAYAASIGSVGTIIGSPPNALLVGYLADTFSITIGFGQWMLAGVPLAMLFTVIAWLTLTKVVFRPEVSTIPGGRALFRHELSELGAWSTPQKRTLAVFLTAVVAWVGVPLVWRADPPISDSGIALVITVALFALPAGNSPGVRLLDWQHAKALPWGVLILFGGGLALSAQFVNSGLTDWIGQQATGLAGIPTVLLVMVIALGVLMLTELTSNTATAATLLPVAGGLAVGLQLDPLLLTVPVALAASCAFMLPVATPPNAIAYGSGFVSIGHMMRGGWLLNLVGVVLVTVSTVTVMAWVFGYQVGS